ncbi:helix-turn-helix domain-containing protein [Gorillibacterium timonense]|uniref:helix-turn-helix domain-containing protein n=1 Tax=Gorillibacterium timonense TaxID=1689269 RepID=UPI0009ECB3CB|nr:helix-turn-helix transcriptional regulator [Gorillibacterium timonense]
MSELRIHEQIAFLRKQKGITQEELAKALGVTNQSVSKWESAICCPDLQLLPNIATYFGITVDELLGYKPADTFGSVYLGIKGLFEASPAEESFAIAYRLAALLHEGAVSRGYKGFVPWETGKNHGMSGVDHEWNYSACSEPEGATIHIGRAVFIADHSLAAPITPVKIREIYNTMAVYQEKDVLTVLFGLYELTKKDFDRFVSLKELEIQCKLPETVVESALSHLPVQVKIEEDGQCYYRIEGSSMHIPDILLMLRDK